MGKCLGKQKKPKLGRKTTFSPQNLSEAQRALNELVETESMFGLDLRYLMENYLEPLRAEALFFDITELILFNSVCLDLVLVQSNFQKKLESHTEQMGEADVDLSDVIYNVGDDFLTSEKDFSIFSKYVVAMSRVQNVITGKSQVDNQKLVQFLETLTSKDQQDEKKKKIMTMESILLKPFQRVMLYPLILERLEKQSEEGTCDKEQILDAIKSIKQVGTQMNDALKKDEETGDEYKAMLKQYGILEYKK